MFELIVFLFNLGVLASAVLAVTCVARRLIIRSRTRRSVGAISCVEPADILPAGPVVGSPGEVVEIWDHVVQLYDCDAELVDSVSDYLGEALRAHEVAVVVATPEHRRDFEAALVEDGFDLVAACREGRYVALDAAATMARFVFDGRVDPLLFDSVVGRLMRTASAAGHPVRAYGEMVALLWDGGHVNAAIELETLWNELGSVLPFSLLCAYPSHDAERRLELDAICHLHSSVLEADPPLALDDVAGVIR
ncbi:MAG: MEDS domain-containing protein [Acidimicrobiales bacterium]